MDRLNNRPSPIITCYHWFSKLGSFCGTSLLWLLCCLPMVTIIPSCIALYDSVAHCVYGPEAHPFKRFFSTFKKELFRGIGLTLIWIVLGVVLFSGFHILTVMGKESRVASIYSMVYLGTMLVPLGVLVWLIPVESRFVHGIGSLHKTALTFAIVHLPVTAGLLGILFLAVLVVSFVPVLVIVVPGIMVTVQCALIERVFKRYEEG